MRFVQKEKEKGGKSYGEKVSGFLNFLSNSSVTFFECLSYPSYFVLYTVIPTKNKSFIKSSDNLGLKMKMVKKKETGLPFYGFVLLYTIHPLIIITNIICIIK